MSGCSRQGHPKGGQGWDNSPLAFLLVKIIISKLNILKSQKSLLVPRCIDV